ncbi:PaaI family thioesterase [Rheinheimera fenheensis]|uniref:PaaI family thioesterase n=1 Tax=Rheinheimera fenheensis TaxID=3152295 RepID=UPI0032617205
MANSLRKANWGLKLFAWRYIPLIGFCSPKIVRMDSKTLEVTMPHSWRTKNHLGSIYFGALAIGADLAGAFLVFSKAKARGVNANFAFKDVEGHFLKRPEATVHFTSHDGDIIDAMIDESLASGERINKPVSVVVTCPSLHGDEPMATFTLTLSVKAKRKKAD